MFTCQPVLGCRPVRTASQPPSEDCITTSCSPSQSTLFLHLRPSCTPLRHTNCFGRHRLCQGGRMPAKCQPLQTHSSAATANACTQRVSIGTVNGQLCPAPALGSVSPSGKAGNQGTTARAACKVSGTTQQQTTTPADRSIPQPIQPASQPRILTASTYPAQQLAFVCH